jgi:hypothetical protein
MAERSSSAKASNMRSRLGVNKGWETEEGGPENTARNEFLHHYLHVSWTHQRLELCVGLGGGACRQRIGSLPSLTSLELHVMSLFNSVVSSPGTSACNHTIRSQVQPHLQANARALSPAGRGDRTSPRRRVRSCSHAAPLPHVPSSSAGS